ncbi:GAF and ANTAR domain-containing protein [Kribbella sp. NPDC000426]|uniref:GAF and ANTAR domain-containing protein n=1 Tax=Kribbella sp. NPDC000426 TaxID=3154255 RepID=UPI003318D456
MNLDRSARVWGAIRAGAEGAPPTLQHAVRACAEAMSAVGAGFAMTPNGTGWEPLLASSLVAAELDDAQFTLGEGPTGDALHRGAPVLASDLTGVGDGRRWPMFGAAAVERGVNAVFAFPVGLGAARVGVLTVYRGERGPLAADVLQDALVYADAVLVLALDERGGGHGTDADQLIAAAFTARRAEVHQAAGVVAARHRISVTDALARLRAYAYSRGLPLPDVAAEVMAGRLSLEIDEPPRPKETGSQHAELDQEEDS